MGILSREGADFGGYWRIILSYHFEGMRRGTPRLYKLYDIYIGGCECFGFLFTALQYFPCHATRYILRLPEGGVSFIEAILYLGDRRIANLLLAEAGR